MLRTASFKIGNFKAFQFFCCFQKIWQDKNIFEKPTFEYDSRMIFIWKLLWILIRYSMLIVESVPGLEIYIMMLCEVVNEIKSITQ